MDNEHGYKNQTHTRKVSTASVDADVTPFEPSRIPITSLNLRGAKCRQG